MNHKLKIYVASPLGFSEAGKNFMYSTFIPLIEKAGYEVLDPWKLTPDKLFEPLSNLSYGEERKNKWEELNKIIGKNNADAINECDGLVAILDGTDVDSGTSAEIGYAAAFKKPILGYRGDFRLSADNEGSIVNLQVEYFIRLNGGKIITTIAELSEELKNVFG
jgi:nucleoside 2-deoxyribosyltransferase